jgi:phosphoribosylformimino-5-aminoimidazole carboxamide ribotide isomerase
MRIIPAIDLKQGAVVHGAGGRRDSYRPITSVLCNDAQPASVAAGFVAKLNLCESYVADLDALAGGEPDWSSYQALLAGGQKLWIDAGIHDARSARPLAELAQREPNISGVIAGLETIRDRTILAEIAAIVGPERLIFSLDLKEGAPLTTSGVWSDMAPVEIARSALDCGVDRILVLDVGQVGTERGGSTASLCRAIRALAPKVELSTGGGIANMQQVDEFAGAGCDAVLISTALHNGTLGRAEIANV